VKAYRVNGRRGPDSLERHSLEAPAPKANEVRIRVHACSLNYRDLGVLRGGYPRNDSNPVIPLSDMAGEIVEVGSDVNATSAEPTGASAAERSAGEHWRVGDRVTANFMRDWVSGKPTEAALRSSFGGGIDGFLREFVCVPAHCLLRVPETLSYEQAATLPCAAVTAWQAFERAQTCAGQTLLLLGTGGVSVFGLQLGKALGCRCIVTSSSDDKLQRAKQLGADELINYKQHPDWHARVRELTDGVGVDQVLEVGGAGTLQQSIASTRVGGTISLIGVLAQTDKQPSIFPAALECMTIDGIYVGSRAMYQRLLGTLVQHAIVPVIDRVFPFDAAHEAYGYFATQAHFGKVVISLNQ
jgi:NADPH:quinone reductase-like Zn-dependent oxidoreductase